MTVVTVVPKEHVANVWHVVSPWLDKAIVRTHGRYHNVDILTSIIEGTASLWLALRDKEIIGSLVFVITVYPGGRKLGRIDYIAGKPPAKGTGTVPHDRDDWFQEMWDAIRAYAKDTGCEALEMVARPGTARYVKQWGGKVIGLFMEYDLEKDQNERKE